MQLDINQEYIDQAAKDLCQRIDAHLMAQLAIESGWTEVVVDAWLHGSSSDINYWCNHNIGKFIKDGNRWVIKDPADATMFSLKWL